MVPRLEVVMFNEVRMAGNMEDIAWSSPASTMPAKASVTTLRQRPLATGTSAAGSSCV